MTRPWGLCTEHSSPKTLACTLLTAHTTLGPFSSTAANAQPPIQRAKYGPRPFTPRPGTPCGFLSASGSHASAGAYTCVRVHLLVFLFLLLSKEVGEGGGVGTE